MLTFRGRRAPVALAACLGLLVSVLAMATSGTSGKAPERADLVLRGGLVYTMNAVRSWAEAVAVRDERIVYVGTDQGSADYVGEETRVVDLGGRMVLPAFQDSHIHPITGGLEYLRCALFDLTTKDELVRAVADCAAADPDAEWIRGGGWVLSTFAPTGIPDKELLDAVVADRPVYLEAADGHTAWVNSKALEIAGITTSTPDPSGGRIDRDPETGEPVGALQDSAMALISGLLPPTTPEDRRAALRYALDLFHRFGVTSFQDAGISTEELETYLEFDRRGELTARVVAALWWERQRGEEQITKMLRNRRRFTQGNLRATSVKIMQDGVLEAKTAAVLKPYLGGEPNERGLKMVEPEALKRIVTRLDEAGFQVHFHGIGDAAVRQCLDAVAAARRSNGPSDHRHHIAHLQMIHPDDIARFRRLGVIANFQPLWAYADEYITELTLPILEPESHRWIYPIGSLLRSGAVVAFGSDWSVSSANPLEEIEVAVTRQDPDSSAGEPFIPEERISLRDALAAFTINAAYVNSHDELTGSIETGKLADLIVLDRNLFAVPTREISEARVLLTLFGGEPVHGSFDLEDIPPGS